jgi:YD repeat-containing protein
VANAAGTFHYFYDLAGRKQYEARLATGTAQPYWFGWAYDAQGRLTGRSAPIG